MAARPISSATISFGLVSVPVQMYSAAESQSTVSFNWLNKNTGARLKQQYVDSKTGDKIEKEDMIKGFEFSKGQYAQFTVEEIKALEEKNTSSIDIVEFVPLEKVDRLFFDKGYFLGPGKGGDRAYRLLAAALKKAGLAAIGQYAARGKGYLVLLRPMENGLVMETLHFADEVRSIKELDLPEGEVKPAELGLAMQLIDHLRKEEFDPTQFKDSVRERMLEQIQAKVQGEEIIAEPAQEAQTQVLDLMEALKRSIAGGGSSSSGKKAVGKGKPAAKAKAPKESKVRQLKKKTA